MLEDKIDSIWEAVESTESIPSMSDKEKNIILFKTISLVDKYNFYEYISVMIDGWVPITEALFSVSSQVSSPYFKEKIDEIITYISSWDSFSKSMKKLPHIFSAQEISLVEAWETTGGLSDSLMKLSEDLKKVYNLRSKIKGALTYPLIIFIFLFLAIIIVLTYVIPSIKPLFDNSDVELPFSTQMLIGTSDFISNNIIFLFLSMCSLFVVFFGYKTTVKWKMQIEKTILSLPLIGRVYKNYILSHVASVLWNLTWSGVNIIKTLKLVGKSSNNATYESLFDDIITDVAAWEKIVDSMRKVDPYGDYFPSGFLQMLWVGEKTANLDSICKKINIQYEKEVESSLANLTKWIEPIAIFLAGIFVVWFALAIFGAILKITQVVW